MFRLFWRTAFDAFAGQERREQIRAQNINCEEEKKMHGNLKKLIFTITAIAMAAGLLSACQTAAPSPTNAMATVAATSAVGQAPTVDPAAKDFVTLKVLYPGDESKRMQEFLSDEFAQKLKADLNTAVEVSWSGWDSYWDKKDMMIAAGEVIDWYWDGYSGLSDIVTAKACQPLDELLEQYGQDILRVIPKDNFTFIDGKIMGIPSQYAPTSEKFKSVIVRSDIMEEVGMTNIASVADLEKFAALALAKHPEMKVLSRDPLWMWSREMFDGNVSFDLNNYIVVNEDTKKAEATDLSEGFMKTAKKAREWFLKGWIPEEVALKPSEGVNRMKTGNFLIGRGAISSPMEDISDLQKNVPAAKLQEFLLAPEKPHYKMVSSSEGLFIGSTAKYPERAMMMLNWMLKSQDNYDFCIYGVEGKDFTISGDTVKLINTDSLWYEWMFRNLNYMKFPDNVTPEFIQAFKTWDDGVKQSCLFGFVFDTSPVKDELANCEQISDEKMVAIITGMLDYDTAFPTVRSALEAAGIQKIVDEYQKQLDAYLTSK
jgi:putative aldouronate transport system substrate-binding protein